MVDFSKVAIDHNYSRQILSDMWGYKSLHAIRRGVVAPKDQNLIILFITKNKSDQMTKYEDKIEQDLLYWEGEEAHGYDNRIASKRDAIHVFYRERDRSDFIYKGKAWLKNFILLKDRPSKFVFQLIDKAITTYSIIEDIKKSQDLSETEKLALIKSRRGQGVYRAKSINLWKSCCVTGFQNRSILIASHIKPWKSSSNEERLNPHNSLLLVPTLDKLFDKGFIGFESNGKILLSSKISEIDWRKIGLTKDLRLRSVPLDVRQYLDYHSEYIYELIH